jgi:hypothetical protein
VSRAIVESMPSRSSNFRDRLAVAVLLDVPGRPLNVYFY